MNRAKFRSLLLSRKLAVSLLALSLVLFMGSFLGPTHQKTEASSLGIHTLNLHGCDTITYNTTTWSPGVVSLATMNSYFSQAFDNGNGWDQFCGGKFVKWAPSTQVSGEIGPASWVNANCAPPGGTALACAYFYSCVNDSYGTQKCYNQILIRDTGFVANALYIINHETGHVLNLQDQTSCSYNGVMYQLPVGSAPCATVYSWPVSAEITEVDFYMWNGP